MHDACRLKEFERWDRLLLQHERAFLSRTMAGGSAFLDHEEQAAIVHDITDIDYCLSQLDQEGLIQT